MGDRHIQPIITDTMLNNNGPNISDGLNFVTCERSLKFIEKYLQSNAFNVSVSLQ